MAPPAAGDDEVCAPCSSTRACTCSPGAGLVTHAARGVQLAAPVEAGPVASLDGSDAGGGSEGGEGARDGPPVTAGEVRAL